MVQSSHSKAAALEQKGRNKTMEPTKKEIGAHIAALRKAKGLTQEQLAGLLGVSAPAVSKWETNSSYPDITLLCPLARALGTNVDTLLQFEEQLSDQEVSARINEVMETAVQGDAAGAEAQLDALLRRWPNCTALQFNAAAAYDGFILFFPMADEDARSRWKRRKRALLEEIRRTGSAAYWQAVTIQLAGLAVSEGDTGRAETLLNELPAYAGDPTAVRVQLCLKKGQPEEALKLAQTELYKSVLKIESCMTTLLNPEVQPDPQKARKACQAYQAVAKAFGLADMSDGFLVEIYLRCGEVDQAAACFARYVEVLTGPPVFPDEELFSPGLIYTKPETAQAVFPPLRRMLLQSVTSEEQYQPLLTHPVSAAALEKLKASLS